MTPKVSVIISNRNDIAMLSITVRSCIEELRPLGKGHGEIIIVDNSELEAYKLLASALPTGYCKEGLLKIYRQDFPCLFSARETAAEKASGDYLFCVDSHMLIGRDCIVDLANFMHEHRKNKTLAFAHAPISWAHHHERNARHDRDISKNELGNWNTAYNYKRTITWKGIPWMCRREWFLDRDKGLNGYGALSEHKVSWGGGDMHIGVKPWLLGFKNWGVPTNPCIHIGPFPKIDSGKNLNSTKVSDFRSKDKYRVYSDSGNFPHAFGFLVSCYILGGEAMMNRNKAAIKERFGNFINVDKWWQKAMEIGHDEKKWLDERKVMSFEEFLETKPWNN